MQTVDRSKKSTSRSLVPLRVAAALMSLTALGAGVGTVGACGVLKKDDVKKAGAQSVEGELTFSRLAPKLEAAKLLTLRGGKALRALGNDGKAYGLKAGALAEETAAQIPFKTLVTDQGAGYALSADSGWFLGAKSVARHVKLDGKPKLFTAGSKGAHTVLAVTEDKLISTYEGKLEIFSLKSQNIVRSEIDWPIRDEPPLSGGYSASEKAYWFASAKTFMFLDEDGTGFSTQPIDHKGLQGTVLAWLFNVTKENFTARSLPTSGAALTSEGLFATADLAAGAKLSAAGGTPDGGTTPGGDETPAEGVPYDFVADIKPITDEACVACHSAKIGGFGPAGIEASWTSHKTVLLDRLSAAPTTGAAMPPGGMDAAKKATLVAWLKGEKKPAPVATATMKPVVAASPTVAPVVVTQAPVNGAVALDITLYSLADGSLTLSNMMKEASASPGNGLPNFPDNIRVVGTATAGTEGKLTFNFTGQSGTYKVELEAYDESDGNNAVKFYVGSTVAGNSALDQVAITNNDTGNAIKTLTLSNSVALVNGGAISLGVVYNDTSERGRLVKLKFTPAN